MHRKITKALWLLTALALLLPLCACGAQETAERELPLPEEEPTAVPEPAETPQVHEWQRGVCRICGEVCEHDWEGGTCTVCGIFCSHRWEDGRCANCGTVCDHKKHDYETGHCLVCGLEVAHSYVNGVCRYCGREPDYIYKMAEFPGAAAVPTKEKGKLEAYHMPRLGGEIEPGARNTRTYEGRRMLDFVVYTPYGYDPAQQYNVLILTPGVGHNAHYWLERDNKFNVQLGRIQGADMLDGLIANGYIEPLIVVVTEYYLHGQPAESAVYLEQNLRYYILPFLAENYSTYASVDENGFVRPAPEHFAYGGASFGAMLGWQLLPGCTDLFSYWGLLSGGFQHDEETIEQINAGIGETNPVRFLYAGDGKRAVGWMAYRNRIRDLVELCDCFEDGKNILFLATEKTSHNYSSWNMGLYNFLQIFFRNEYIPGFEPERAEIPKPEPPDVPQIERNDGKR